MHGSSTLLDLPLASDGSSCLHTLCISPPNFRHERQGYYIRESVDSLCRDDADMPMPPYIRKAYNRPNAAFVSLFR